MAFGNIALKQKPALAVLLLARIKTEMGGGYPYF